MQRKHYTEEEKNAVMSRYAAGGEEVKSMLKEYGIPKSTFNQWLREYDTKHNCQSENDYSPRNFRHLKARNLHLEDIIAVLNESYCSPRASLREHLHCFHLAHCFALCCFPTYHKNRAFARSVLSDRLRLLPPS